MSAIDTFIFDCDGTVLNTLPDLAEATNRTLEDLGYPTHTEEEIMSYIGDGARRLIFLALPSTATDKEKDRAFEHWCKVYVELGFSKSEYYPGMNEVLCELKSRDKKLAVLSNKIDSATKLVIEQYYPGMFNAVYGERKGIPRKPDPQGLRSVIEELGSVPSKTLYVGDAVTDVQVAKRAKTVSVAAAWGYTKAEDLAQAHPDLLATEPKDLLMFA